MPRRGENIYKRKDGRWEGRLIRGHHPNGKAIYQYVYGKSYSEAKRKLLDLRSRRNVGADTVNQRVKYKDILNEWLIMSQIRTKESTFSHYTHLSKLHILPFLGEIPIEHLTTKIVEDHILMLLSSGRIDGTGGLSPKTVSDILAIIKGSIAYAKNSGKQVTCYLEQITIRKSQVDMRVLNREEEERLRSTLLFDTDFSKLGVLLCLYTGIRIGEVCALKWGNFNFEAGTLSIYETLQRIQNVDDGSKHKTKIVVTTPKSQNSVRIIPLPDSLINILGRFKSSPRAYILTGCDDRFMEPRVLQYKFKKYAIESGVRNINYHALRHTFATRCIELGFDVKTLSEILGHANVNVTLNRYVHSSMELKRTSMQLFRF